MLVILCTCTYIHTYVRCFGVFILTIEFDMDMPCKGLCGIVCPSDVFACMKGP